MLAGSRQDAEDALQDVFLRAYGALRADDRPVTLRAWLYRVAHNRCIDQLRRVSPAPADVMDVSRTPLHDPLAEAERREDLRRLVDDVRRLPEQQRSALLMRELEGLSYAELAGALNVTVPAVKSLLVRARIGLAEALEARDAACGEVRADLASAHGRGVRSSGLARRHMRDCVGCREYRHQLRLARRSFAALSPAAPGPISALLQLIGIGGGSGAGAAGSVGTIVTSAGTATKVAAIVSAAAITAGGAVEVHHRVAQPPAEPPVAKVASATPVKAPAPVKSQPATFAPPPLQLAKPKSEAAGSTSAARDGKHAKAKEQEAMSPHSAAASEPVSATENAPGAAALLTTADARGGTAAPDEPSTATQDPTVGVGGAQPATTDPATAAAPTADTAPAPADSGTTPSDDDAASPPANGSGGLSAPPAP
jgi:RNA polymerase sigma factor (sigma-70 family)